VHWKVTAHVGELAVKEYEPLRHDLISIHLDLTSENHYGTGALSTLETTISAAASLARAGLAEQRSVSLMGPGLPAEVGRPGTGQAHLHRIMVALAEARNSEDRFSEVLGLQLRSVPRGASVFIITTGAERGLAQTVASSAAAADSVVLLIVEGQTDDRGDRITMTPRQVAEAAQAAGISVGVLQSPADIGDVLTAARGGTRRGEAGVV
jgi:uncharacterized protein (DUF58 family)